MSLKFGIIIKGTDSRYLELFDWAKIHQLLQPQFSLIATFYIGKDQHLILDWFNNGESQPCIANLAILLQR
jgi:hypothetical protein